MTPHVQRRGSLALGLGLLGILLLACSPATRFKVLHFFFDGVPDGKPKKHAPQRPPSPYHPLRAPRKPAPAALSIVSTHKPVAERQCRQCHESGGSFVPIVVDEKLCDKCHRVTREREGWNHGPINLETCLPCHRAHESPYPHLLDLPLPELCLTCHKDDLQSKRKYHQVPNISQCMACHDPHRVRS